MWPLKNNFKRGVDSIRIPAAFLNCVASMLNSFEVRFWANEYAEVQRSDDGSIFILWLPEIGSTADDNDTWNLFGYRDVPGNKILVRARTIRMHTIANVAVPEAEVALSGNPAWVYFRIIRATPTTSPALMVQSVEPTSDATLLCVPLYRFVLDPAAGTYSLGDPCTFDVNLDAPMA